MPDIFVFPGGRLDREDHFPSGFPEHTRGPVKGWDRFSKRHHMALLRAALRETLEETGLLIAETAAAPAKTSSGVNSGARQLRSEAWAAYRKAQRVPAFRRISPLARAITPPTSPKRFHTRFYLTDGALAQGRIRGDGELRDIAWVPVKDTERIPMAEVGQLVLREALRRLENPEHAKCPLFHWVGDKRRQRT